MAKVLLFGGLRRGAAEYSGSGLAGLAELDGRGTGEGGNKDYSSGKRGWETLSSL